MEISELRVVDTLVSLRFWLGLSGRIGESASEYIFNQIGEPVAIMCAYFRWSSNMLYFLACRFLLSDYEMGQATRDRRRYVDREIDV